MATMAFGEAFQCVCGCCGCILWLIWLGLGIAAAISGYDDAEGCGWWLYVMFIVQLVYVPFAILFGFVYGGLAWSSLCIGDVQGASSGSAFCDGAVRGAVFLVLTGLGGAVAGLSAKALWHGDCSMDGTRVRTMAEAGFYAVVVVTGVSVALGIAEAVRALLQRCAD